MSGRPGRGRFQGELCPPEQLGQNGMWKLGLGPKQGVCAQAEGGIQMQGLEGGWVQTELSSSLPLSGGGRRQLQGVGLDGVCCSVAETSRLWAEGGKRTRARPEDGEVHTRQGGGCQKPRPQAEPGCRWGLLAHTVLFFCFLLNLLPTNCI